MQHACTENTVILEQGWSCIQEQINEMGAALGHYRSI